jgi:hypothetical protein
MTIFSTMAPPKQVEPRQTSRKSRFRTKAQVQSQESEQQTPKVINVDEIPSLDTTPMNPTPVVEETQLTTPEGMNMNIPTEEQGQQNEGIGNQVQLENPEEALRVNGTALKQAEAIKPDE